MTQGNGLSINEKLNNLLSLQNVAGEAEKIHPATRPMATQTERTMAFSVIFFSDVNQALDHKYQLVFDVTAFADQHGFTAVWLPERHFHPFGGIYPSPATLAAALAVKTKHIRLRSGSVVLPLHHPIEVVETWSMVDNLSAGRVDLGFASGWNPNDFILSPGAYGNLKQVWHERIPLVQKLWRGEPVTFENGKGEPVEIQVYPKPIQPDLNIWFVISKSDESFKYAGSQGYNVLTMLQGIDLDELGKKIRLYRTARQENGFNPDEGLVTLMLHTLVHQDLKLVEEAVREPFFAYIKSALSGHIQVLAKDQRPSEAELNKIVDYSYERYFKTGALFGSIKDTEPVVAKASAVGVNEIACLMDFGVDYRVVMDSLAYLDGLNDKVRGRG
jgi:natural product biosynthesis luciferase-like monooxygenase protein